MKLALVVVLVAAADTATMLLLPHGAELNPIAAGTPLVATGLKWLTASLIAVMVWERRRYFRGVGLIASALWGIGVASNVRVLL